MIKNLPKTQGQMASEFIGEFYETFREELVLILLKHFQKIAEEGTIPNSFYKATHHHPNTKTRDNTKKENYRPISLTNIDAKILNKILTNQKRQSLQYMVLWKLDSYMEKNEIRTLSNTIHKNKLKMDQKLKCKPRHYKILRGKPRKNTLWHKLQQLFFFLLAMNFDPPRNQNK